MTTTPVEPTIPQTISLSSVSELQTQAQRLGLTWDLRAATVAESSGAFTAYVPRIVLDGDSNQSAGTTAVSFIGGVAEGMRVMVMFVPPVGAYIVGTFNPVQMQRFEIGAQTSHGTTITTTETVMETFPSFTVLAGAAYRIEIGGWILAAPSTFTFFRIRKSTVGGQSLYSTPVIPGISLAQGVMQQWGYFVNRGTDPIISDIVFTAVTNTSTSTWSADVERPRYVSLQYVGPAVEYPSAVGIV